MVREGRKPRSYSSPKTWGRILTLAPTVHGWVSLGLSFPFLPPEAVVLTIRITSIM